MKDRLVFWGKKNDTEKVLITMDLDEDHGTFEVQIIKAENVTEDFENLVRNEWRNNSGDVIFPDIDEKFTRELSLTQDILPKEYQVDRDDLLKMAQAEWNFFVLSKRLRNAYNEELEEYEEQLASLKEYSQELWSNMKTFWDKVQKQITERNLARRHGNDLKRRTNAIFAGLKSLRARSESKFVEESQILKDKFLEKLQGLESNMKEGKSLRHLFDELKKVQKEFKNLRFTREDHNQVWEKLDGLFKDIKAKKYGKSAVGNDPLVKTANRLDGLNSAINRMKKSIHKDKKELQFQKNKIEQADGQLEAQIRRAKLSMLEERIHAKELKLEDMFKTEKQLADRLSNLRKKAEKEAAEQAVKDRIAREIQEKQDKSKLDPKVQEAAAKIAGKFFNPSRESLAQETAAVISAVVKASGVADFDEEE
ncbi:MAG TPA: hypothetical protein VKZ56_07020 [Membranihabitans sp.]|nr:hypothetical protein [Membranihabitans sp.]